MVDLIYDVLNDIVRVLRWTEEPLKQCLCPNDAVDQLLWLLSDCAYREALVLRPLHTLITRRLPLTDWDAL